MSFIWKNRKQFIAHIKATNRTFIQRSFLSTSSFQFKSVSHNLLVELKIPPMLTPNINKNDLNTSIENSNTSNTSNISSTSNNNNNKQSSLSVVPPQARYSETTSTAVHSDWYESETEYHVVARFLVGVDTSNMHLYVENGQIVIEATKDTKDRNAFKSSSNVNPITQRTSLFLRRTIEIPVNADLNRITSKILGDTIMIAIPKTMKGKL